MPIQTASGVARTGKGLSESTFRKEYHALKTLHIHFQSADKYQVNKNKVVNIHCSTVELYIIHSYTFAVQSRYKIV